MSKKTISVDALDRKMQILDDIKKVVEYDKYSGTWFWRDRDDEDGECYNKGFKSFLAAVNSAIEPYEHPEET